MKKILMTIAAAILLGVGTMNAQGKVTVEKTAPKTFTAKKAASSRGSGYHPTGYTYVDTDGKAYEIHTHEVTKGASQGQTKCYIQRVGKNSGKPYWKEIPVRPEELR